MFWFLTRRMNKRERTGLLMAIIGALIFFVTLVLVVLSGLALYRIIAPCVRYFLEV